MITKPNEAPAETVVMKRNVEKKPLTLPKGLLAVEMRILQKKLNETIKRIKKSERRIDTHDAKTDTLDVVIRKRIGNLENVVADEITGKNNERIGNLEKIVVRELDKENDTKIKWNETNIGHHETKIKNLEKKILALEKIFKDLENREVIRRLDNVTKRLKNTVGLCDCEFLGETCPKCRHKDNTQLEELKESVKLFVTWWGACPNTGSNEPVSCNDKRCAYCNMVRALDGCE